MKYMFYWLGIVLLISCSTKNKYDIMPYTKPVSQTVDPQSDIRNDTTRLRLIPNVGNWDASVQVYEDLQYNQYLTRFYGWNGGDGNYSHKINDTTTLWTFQDSFIGIVDANRNRDPSLNKFVRNAAVLQYNHSMQSFVQLNPGELKNSKTWMMYDNLESNDEKEIYWPGDGHVVNGKFQILLARLVYDQTGTFEGLQHPATDLAIFSIPDMTLQQVIKNKYIGDVSYDAGILDDEDGYTYIYGNSSAFLSYNLHIARAPNHDLTQPWQFLTAAGWANTPDNYTVLHDTQSLLNVFRKGSKYYMVSQGPVFGREIYIWESNTPTGPFISKRKLYTVPQDDTRLTYNATVHASLSEQGELVIAYNINPNAFSDNFNAPGSADKYRPKFIRVFNWQ